MIKICSKCKEQKLFGDFTKDKRSPDKLDYWCKKCRNHYYKFERKNPPCYHQSAEDRRKWKRKYDQKLMMNPLHRLSNNMRGNMHHALKAKKDGRKWESLAGYSLQDLINHIEPLLKNGMTWENYGSIWHVDHITPKSWFKYESIDDPRFKQCWSLSNLQPKLKIDNSRKGNRFTG